MTGPQDGARAVLHVGPHKTGTSYLQQWFASWEPDERVRYLRAGRADHYSHWQLAWEPLAPPWLPTASTASPDGWSGVAQELADEPAQTVLVSHEDFALSTFAPHRGALVRLFAPRRVEVVVCGRSLDRVLPSLWQERLREGQTVDLEGAVADLVQAPSVRLDELAQAWSDTPGVDRVTVVTVPPRGEDVLRHRMSEAIGVAGLEERPLPDGVDRNASMSAAAADALLRVNRAVHLLGLLAPDAVPPPEARRQRLMRREVLERLQAAGLVDGAPITLTTAQSAALRRLATDVARGLREGPAHVVGHLDDLLVGDRADTGGRGAPVDDGTAGLLLSLASSWTWAELSRLEI